MEIISRGVSKGYIFKEGLFKKKKISVLENVNLRIKQGEIIAVLGDAKGGKSTLVNLLCGKSKPDEGEILINGEKDINSLKANCAVVDELDNRLLGNESVYNNLVYFGKKLNMNELDIEKRIVDLKNVFDFEKVINFKVNDLNTLYLAKVNLAIKVLDYPCFVFVDDVLNTLSVVDKVIILKDLRRLNKEYKTSIIVISKDFDDVEKICKRVVFIRNGSVLIDDELDNVKNKYFLSKIVSVTFNRSFNIPKGEFNVVENNDYSLVVEIDFSKCDFASFINQFDVNTITDISIKSNFNNIG